MANFVGVLIRRERLRQNCSQEGLCRGICAVSYLSKIEQGKAEAGDDILLPLLERLGIVYETDPDFLAQAEKLVESLYDDLFSGKEDLPQFRKKLDSVAEQEQRYLSSRYMLDILLLQAYCHPVDYTERDTFDRLEDFVPCMTRRQYGLYLMLRLYHGPHQLGEELLRLNPCGFYTTMVGGTYSNQGRYTEAIALLSRGYDLAAQEGSVHLMILAKMLLGNCYCITGHRDLMQQTYAVTRKLAQAVDYPGILAHIDYNIASAYLDWDMPQEAYDLLAATPSENLLYFHKLALSLEKLGRPDEALSALERGYEHLDKNAAADSVYHEILDLVKYRLDHPDYLRDGVYAALMLDTFAHIEENLPVGFVRAHVPYLLQVLEAERRYKDAYQVMQKYFRNQ